MARSTPIKAADLVGRVVARRAPKDPSPEALAELDKLVTFNRKATSAKARVRADEARELLASYGWRRGAHTFNALIRRRYGHGWGG